MRWSRCFSSLIIQEYLVISIFELWRNLPFFGCNFRSKHAILGAKQLAASRCSQNVYLFWVWKADLMCSLVTQYQCAFVSGKSSFLDIFRGIFYIPSRRCLVTVLHDDSGAILQCIKLLKLMLAGRKICSKTFANSEWCILSLQVLDGE